MTSTRWIILGSIGFVIVAILLLVSLRADEITVEDEITVAAEPYDLWLIIAAPEHRASWMGNINSAARMTGEPGYVGASMLLNLKVDQFSMVVFEDVIEADSPFLMRTLTTDNRGALSVETTYTITRDDDVTRLRVTETRNLEGTWATWFAPFIEPRARGQLQENMARLKDIAEALAPEAP